MLPYSVPCYKAFYQDDDGLLHTKHGAASVSVGGRLTVPDEGGDLVMCKRGIHFCVTVEDCLAYYKEEMWGGKRRVVAQVTPLGGECLFAADKYCAWGVEVERLLGAEEKHCLAMAIAAAGVDPASDDNLAIQWASRNGYADAVRLLLADPRVDPSDRDNWAIIMTCGNGHAEVVRLLLADPRVDPSTDNNIATRWALCNDHADVVCLLLEDPRVDPGTLGNYAIQWASKYGHADVVRLLLADPRVDPSADDNFAIQKASINGHADVVRVLLTDSRVRLALGADDNLGM